MIPNYKQLDEEQDTVEFLQEPNKTYKLNYDQEVIAGMCDTTEAVKQSIYKQLATEQYEYPIYDWGYGIKTNDLIGTDVSYVYAVLKKRIEEALLQDDRVETVTDFQFQNEKGKVSVEFKIISSEGEFHVEKVVNI